MNVRPAAARTPAARASEPDLLKLARDGDERAFAELTGGYQAELRAHCYRLLGSLQDAEDAVQDAMLRSWRAIARFEGRGSVRGWLYAIATNAALDIARRRSRRELPVDFGPAAAHGADVDAPATEASWLEPMPEQWLMSAAGPSPEARYDQRESVELAFVVALQHLAPLQRAALLLREVAGFSAAEIAVQLGTSPAAVNSALQRARAARARLPARSQQATLRQLGDDRIRSLVQRYADALEHGDADTLIGMLTADATWSMPPTPTWFSGLTDIRDWLLRSPLRERWRHVPTAANGQPAVAGYLLNPAGVYAPCVIDVLTLEGDKISAVTAFLTEPEQLFARFGLPDHA